MKFVSIVLMSVIAAMCYGIVHDQITIRVCPEYFTVAHPRIINTQSLTVLAAVWGVVATWWVGLPLGILVGLATRTGTLPRLEPSKVTRAVIVLLFSVGLLAGLAGGIVWLLQMGEGLRGARPDLASQIDPSRHDRFMVAWISHTVSYCAGVIGGIALAIGLFRYRVRLNRRVRNMAN